MARETGGEGPSRETSSSLATPMVLPVPFAFWGKTVSVAHLPLPLLVTFGTAGSSAVLASACLYSGQR